MLAGPRRKRGDGSTLALIGIVASAAAAWLFGAWQIGQNKSKKARSDASYLTQMLALPLKYTEHAQCRMDCRCELPFNPDRQHAIQDSFRNNVPAITRASLRSERNLHESLHAL